MSRYLSIGIDLGTHNTRVLIGESSDTESRGFAILGKGLAESRGLRHGYVVHLEETTSALREAVSRAEKEAGIRVRKGLIAIGGISLESEVGTGSIIISRIDGEIDDADVEKAIHTAEENIKTQNKKILHRFPLGFKLDNKEILGRPQGMRGVKLEARVLFVLSLAQHLDDFIAACEGAGIEVEDIVASPLAASIATLTKLQRTAGCVLANIGAETVSVAMFENDQLMSMQVFPIGSTDITNDIALGLKIPLEEADDIKKGIVTDKNYPHKKLNDIINARLGDIFDCIEGHLKKLGRSELLPAGVILTGEGAELVGIGEFARVALKLPARVIPPHVFKNSPDVPLTTGWATASGLCIIGFDPTYRSDLRELSTIKVKSHIRGIAGWMRQFLP